MLNSKDCSGLLQGFAAKWKPVHEEEMLAFLGLCLAMGIQKLPQRHDYWWKTNCFFETKFNEVMTRDQLDSIWQYLHCKTITSQTHRINCGSSDGFLIICNASSRNWSHQNKMSQLVNQWSSIKADFLSASTCHQSQQSGAPKYGLCVNQAQAT